MPTGCRYEREREGLSTGVDGAKICDRGLGLVRGEGGGGASSATMALRTASEVGVPGPVLSGRGEKLSDVG